MVKRGHHSLRHAVIDGNVDRVVNGGSEIRIEQLGDSRIPAGFQFEKRDGDDEDVPVVRVNLVAPRYVELRGVGSMSGQAQQRLKQYLVDVSLVSIAEYHSKERFLG